MSLFSFWYLLVPSPFFPCLGRILLVLFIFHRVNLQVLWSCVTVCPLSSSLNSAFIFSISFTFLGYILWFSSHFLNCKLSSLMSNLLFQIKAFKVDLQTISAASNLIAPLLGNVCLSLLPCQQTYQFLHWTLSIWALLFITRTGFQFSGQFYFPGDCNPGHCEVTLLLAHLVMILVSTATFHFPPFCVFMGQMWLLKMENSWTF